jgi:hypothetical protein
VAVDDAHSVLAEGAEHQPRAAWENEFADHHGIEGTLSAVATS